MATDNIKQNVVDFKKERIVLDYLQSLGQNEWHTWDVVESK